MSTEDDLSRRNSVYNSADNYITYFQTLQRLTKTSDQLRKFITGLEQTRFGNAIKMMIAQQPNIDGNTLTIAIESSLLGVPFNAPAKRTQVLISNNSLTREAADTYAQLTNGMYSYKVSGKILDIPVDLVPSLDPDELVVISTSQRELRRTNDKPITTTLYQYEMYKTKSQLASIGVFFVEYDGDNIYTEAPQQFTYEDLLPNSVRGQNENGFLLGTPSLFSTELFISPDFSSKLFAGE